MNTEAETIQYNGNGCNNCVNYNAPFVFLLGCHIDKWYLFGAKIIN